MAALIGGANHSTVSVDKSGMTIRLPSQVFGKGWLLLLARLLSVIVKHMSFPFPQRIMTSRESSDQAPNWIKVEIDGLSWLLFLLKVPKEHQLVRLWKAIDWVEINHFAIPYYNNAHGGRPAWAPAQLVAMLILMFLYGIAHETTLVRQLQENIVWSWFTGFGLFGPYPTHDALYEFRKRVGKECFQQILTLAVQACMQAGLVDNKLVHFDLTPTVATAHRWSPYERAVILTSALIRYLELVWDQQTPQEPFLESLKNLAAEVALETLPHKSLKAIKPERVLQSVNDWQEKAGESNPVWQEATQQLAQELFNEQSSKELCSKLDPQRGTASKKTTQAAQRVEAQLATEATPTAEVAPAVESSLTAEISFAAQTVEATQAAEAREGGLATEAAPTAEINLAVSTIQTVEATQTAQAVVTALPLVEVSLRSSSKRPAMEENGSTTLLEKGSVVELSTSSLPNEQKRASNNVIKVEQIEVISAESAAGRSALATASQLGQKQDRSSPEQEPVTQKANNEHEAIRSELKKVARKIIKGMPHTRGDVDAKVGRTTNYTWFCGYLMGFVVDDKRQVITSVILGAGNSKQATLLLPALNLHIERVAVPEALAADSAFDEYPVHSFLDHKGIIGHVSSRDHSKPKDGGYGTDRVTWADEQQNPFCPSLEPLLPVGQAKKDGTQSYQGTACGSCEQYQRCYPSGEGQPKKFSLKPAAHRRWQENRQHNQSDEYSRARRARFVSEGRFGLAKNNHHAANAPYRSDEMNLIAALMIASMMNWRILANSLI